MAAPLPADLLHEFWENFRHNLFKPLLLFFYAGFSAPILRVPFEFPHILYQSLTIYLLVAIGWHGGEQLAALPGHTFAHALGFMLIGFVTNFIIGCVAYAILRKVTRLRRVDAATVAGYYGSDSAGTFVTCVGVLTLSNIAFAAYMPVMLAVMEIPGCLVALYLVSRLRRKGMDPQGNMADEPGYDPGALPPVSDHGPSEHGGNRKAHQASNGDSHEEGDGEMAAAGATVAVKARRSKVLAQRKGAITLPTTARSGPARFDWGVLHEVFLNPGLFLLFAGIAIGFISRLQGEKVTAPNDLVFDEMFQGALCLFLLEMGITACRRLRDLRTGGVPFVLFGIVAPNVFATIGIFVAHGYSAALGEPFEIGTYVLFAVLCAAASYIAVPAVQRLAIPEASPTLPLAASLGLTFSYNVTIGIPVYIMIATAVTQYLPVG
jgi:hypothetical protein